MPWYPKYNLYAANGSTLVYAFQYILSDNSPQDSLRFTEITGFRGQGSIIIPGSTQPWDLQLTFFLRNADYASLIAAILLTFIPPKTIRYLCSRMFLPAGSTVDQFPVKYFAYVI